MLSTDKSRDDHRPLSLVVAASEIHNLIFYNASVNSLRTWSSLFLGPRSPMKTPSYHDQ